MTITYITAGMLALAGAPAPGSPAPVQAAAAVWTASFAQGRGQPAEARGNQGRGNARAEAGEQGREQADPQREGRAQADDPRQAGQGKARGRPASQGEARGRAARAARGRVSPERLRQGVESLPTDVRRFATSRERHERMVAGALARAAVRGLAPAALVVSPAGDGLRVRNGQDELLLDLDRDRARDLGAWEVRRLGDQRPGDGSPAFCRSGEGHPVWGREWCIEKRFGLGGDGVLWSRGTVDDVVFDRRPDRDRLDRGSLIDVVGDVVFNRLALHALSLGYDQPLSGAWVADPQGPQLVRIYSGDRPVAELVDTDRDDRVEVLYVAQLR